MDGGGPNSAGPGADTRSASPTATATLASATALIGNAGHGSIDANGNRQGHRLQLGLGIGLGGALLIALFVSAQDVDDPALTPQAFFLIKRSRGLERREFKRKTANLTAMVDVSQPKSQFDV